MVAALKQSGMVVCVRERLKIFVKTVESWVEHHLSTLPLGQAAFLIFTDLNTLITSCSWKAIVSVCEYSVDGWWGCGEVLDLKSSVKQI